MFKTIKAALVGFGAVLCLATSANATVIFEDDFDSYGAQHILNWNGGAKWTVLNGAVDYLNDATDVWGISCEGGAGGCVDLDGSSDDAGQLRKSGTNLYVNGQSYRFEFDLSGHQRENTSDDDVRIRVFGGLLDTIITLSAGDGFSHYTYDFIGDGTYRTFYFENAGADNVGAILDNVRMSTVPGPAALGLIGFGLLGMGAAARRRRQVAAK